jgi:hypothetical protein
MATSRPPVNGGACLCFSFLALIVIAIFRTGNQIWRLWTYQAAYTNSPEVLMAVMSMYHMGVPVERSVRKSASISGDSTLLIEELRYVACIAMV